MPVAAATATPLVPKWDATLEGEAHQFWLNFIQISPGYSKSPIRSLLSHPNTMFTEVF